MPPIGWHVATAREVLHRLDAPQLESLLGCYLLGATAPDIRVITGQRREETHFFDLETDHDGSGVPRLFERYPHLFGLKDRPQAFVCGYITHLCLDELWIEDVYRPYFGEASTLTSTIEANLMDRLLQFYMDREERLNRDRFRAFWEYVSAADPGVEIGFIEPPALSRWREVVTRVLQEEPDWERFRSLTLRRLGPETAPGDEAAVRAFFEAIPEALERTLQYVTEERLRTFKEDAVLRSTRALREYLG